MTDDAKPNGPDPAPEPQDSQDDRREATLKLEPFLSPSVFKRPRRLRRWLWPFLAVNVLALAGLVVYMLAFREQSVTPVAPEPDVAVPKPPPTAKQPPPTPKQPPASPALGAVSWQIAKRAYTAKQFEVARTHYAQLLEAAKGNPRDELMRDFLRLRIAQCQRDLGQRRHARSALVRLIVSRSPIIRGCAMLHIARLDAAEGQYLAARTQAYRALALFGAVDGTALLQNACDVLIAETLTRKALSFFNDDENLPPSRPVELDPFLAVETEETLRATLKMGAQYLSDSTFGPKAHLSQQKKGEAGPRWTVASARAPLEEVLCRLAGTADLNIDWGTVDSNTRNRPVTLCLRDATDHRVVEVACGAAGLLARLAGTRAAVYNPRAIATTDDLRDLLLKESISLWRRLFLRESDPERLIYGHFALGMLYEHAGDSAGALAESPLAPHASLRCATVRIDLRDYTGAREDLLALLDHHPNFPACDMVYLRLGQAAMKAGLLDEAVMTFKRLYYYELSQPSKIGAALGAGTCYAAMGKPKAASEWLARFASLAHRAGKDDEETAEAGYLLAKSLREDGRPQEAKARLLLMLQSQPTEPLRTNALLALAQAVIQQEDFPSAFAVFRRIDTTKVAPPLADRAVLLEAQTLRQVDLPGRAIRMLKNRQPDAASPRTAALMSVELGRCYADAGDFERGRRLLTEALPKFGRDPPANEVACELARLCLKTGQAAQAIGLCRELLMRDVPGVVRRRALNLLGIAYVHKRDHDRAVVALAGQVPAPEGATQP